MRTDRDRRFVGIPQPADHVGGAVHMGNQSVLFKTFCQPPPGFHIGVGQAGAIDAFVFRVEPDFFQFKKIVLDAFQIDFHCFSCKL